MSWLNFNESLNTIKGQITNFASGVLAEGIVNSSEDEQVNKTDKTDQQDFNLNSSVRHTAYNDNNWMWESPVQTSNEKNSFAYGLQAKIDILEKEKEELLTKLEQLDLDHQQATHKLLSLKDNLQGEYSELKNDYEKLKNEYGEVLNENLEKNKQLEALRNHKDDNENDVSEFRKLESQLKEQLEKTCQTIEENKRLKETKEDLELRIQELEQKVEAAETEAKNGEETLNSAILEKGELEKRISDFEQLQQQNEFEGKIRELERSLEEMQKLHGTFMNLVTEGLKKYVQLDMTSDMQFVNKIEILLQVLVDFKTRINQLEEEMCQITEQKNGVIAEKNFEIEKLLQNSEILSQEVITKTRAIKDYEDECAELMKNNDLLIMELENFKKSGLQTISESNEDNMLLMESQLENANKKIQDMEVMISDLENLKQDCNDEIQAELEYIKRQLNMTGQELSKSKADGEDLLTRYSRLEDEKNTLKTALEKIKSDYENVEYKFTEVNVGAEALKEEGEELRRKIAILDAKSKKLEDLNVVLEGKTELLQNAVDEGKNQLALAEDSLHEKEVQIRSYIERLQNSKMTETGLKLQVDTLSKELQSTLEAKQNLESKTEAERNALQEQYAEVIQSNNNLQEKNTSLEAQITELSQSKNDLIALVTAKHEENVSYHSEIQRLTEAISTKKNEDLEKLTDQNNFLREKCEVLAQNLLEEQSKTQKVLSEQNTTSEREQWLSKEVERLRVHLVEVEDMYTQELVQAEQKNKDMLAKVNEIEQREKNSSSIYTSVSIRANQQVETLQNQLQLVGNQRDELRAKISDIEDENNRHVAALTNLQLVLEQFQKDKDKDVQLETERIRRQIVQEKKVQDDLRKDNDNLKTQLEESKQGLQAAARLTDQLERCKKQVVNFKDEVSKLQEKLQKTEGDYQELSVQTDTKVDKSLIKNLIIGYISSNANDQKQILKVIATVLGFNKKESDKVDLNKPHNSGWLSTILHPQGIANAEMTQDSLSTAFVKFLESESKPKVLPNLLTSKQRKVSEDASSTGSTPPPLVLSEIVLPTFVDFGKNRNSSSILKDVLKDNT